MKISRQNLEDVSHLVFDGFLSEDVFISDTYFTMRTLTTEERLELSDKYKYLPKAYNLSLIIELLSCSIYKVGGIKIEQKVAVRFLSKCQSFLCLYLYELYNKLDARVSSSQKCIDYFIESKESKYFWGLFKLTHQQRNFDTLKHINQFQYYWVVMNSYKDMLDGEKREWSRTEYMTSTICAFVNPQAYRKAKNKMNVSDRFAEYEDKLVFRKKMLEEIEKLEEIEIEDEDEATTENGLVSADRHVFDQLKKKDDETKEQYADRVNDLMMQQISGKVIDEYDEQVRKDETDLLRKLLLEKRVRTEVIRGIRENRTNEDAARAGLSPEGILREEEAIIGADEQLDIIDESIKKKGFYHDHVSYLDIVEEKAFTSIPKNEKEAVFDEVMTMALDIKAATKVFLNDLYKDDKKEGNGTEGQDKGQQPIETHARLAKTDRQGLEPLEDAKLAAEKASKMNIGETINKPDLLDTKKQENDEKVKRYYEALDRRNMVIKPKEEKQPEAEAETDVDELHA